jgi:hypothetical protein
VLLLEPRGAVRLRIAAIGDVAMIGRVRERVRRDGWDAPLAAAAPALAAAHVGFANLECPVGEPAWVVSGKSPEFWQEDGVAPALRRAHVEIVSLANNHVMDCGPRGLARTREACLAAGLLPIGAGANLDEARAPARIEREGVRVVALAYGTAGRDRAASGTPGIAPLDLDVVREDLLRWRREADLLMVSAHWGSMYVDYPPPRVLELARLLAESADLVLGHHPHVLQGWRRVGRHLALFSLGDACFDPRAGEVHATVAEYKRAESGVLTVSWADEPGLEIVPLVLDDDGVPRVPDAARAAAQCARLASLAAGLDSAEARFASEAAPVLLRYEIESLKSYLKRGRLDRALRLLGTLRPRHLPVLWQALRKLGRTA